MVILEQIKFSVLAKHKWSAIALLNSIISSTETIEKRLAYRNSLFGKRRCVLSVRVALIVDSSSEWSFVYS